MPWKKVSITETDVIEISAMVAAVGVLVGVVYYVLDLRHQTKMRQTDLLARLYSPMTSKEWMEAWGRVNAYDMKTTNLEKLWTENRLVDYNMMVGMYFEELGVFLQMGLLNVDQVEKLLHRHVVRMWEFLKPLTKEIREAMNDPQLGQGWEYLYNELKKRQQRGVLSVAFRCRRPQNSKSDNQASELNSDKS